MNPQLLTSSMCSPGQQEDQERELAERSTSFLCDSVKIQHVMPAHAVLPAHRVPGPNQVPVKASGKTAKENAGTQASVTYMGGPEKVLCSWLWPRAAQLGYTP